jgi:GDP-4-dehydro-6-deoxy-D-mannose reductase
VRVLVTGATGFVGHHLCALLTENGHQVVGVVRDPLAEHVPAGVGTFVADVTDPVGVRAAVAETRPDAIAHLAGGASVGRSFAAPAQTWEVNLGGTLAVLEAVRLAAPATRVLVVTSSEQFGFVAPEQLPISAATVLRPVSPYGASKAAADLAAVQYHLGYGMDVVRVCPFNHIGPGQDVRFVVPSIARQIALAEIQGEDAVRLRAGNIATRRDFTDVRDVVRAYLALLETGEPGDPYFVCTGVSRAISDLIDGLAACSRLEVDVERDPALVRSGEQPNLYGSFERIAAATGWRPQIPLEQTLADTLEWWRAHVTDKER